MGQTTFESLIAVDSKRSVTPITLAKQLKAKRVTWERMSGPQLRPHLVWESCGVSGFRVRSWRFFIKTPQSARLETDHVENELI